jgi:hypothetical protein
MIQGAYNLSSFFMFCFCCFAHVVVLRQSCTTTINKSDQIGGAVDGDAFYSGGDDLFTIGDDDSVPVMMPNAAAAAASFLAESQHEPPLSTTNVTTAPSTAMAVEPAGIVHLPRSFSLPMLERRVVPMFGSSVTVDGRARGACCMQEGRGCGHSVSEYQLARSRHAADESAVSEALADALRPMTIKDDDDVDSGDVTMTAPPAGSFAGAA